MEQAARIAVKSAENAELRAFLLVLRKALLMIVKYIEGRYLVSE